MMDFRKLERANKLRCEIEDLDALVRSIKYSIENYVPRDDQTGKARFLRFMNRQKKGKDKPEADVIFFSGLSMYGVEIPLDNEMCEELLEILQRRLAKKSKEFSSFFIGTEASEKEV